MATGTSSANPAKRRDAQNKLQPLGKGPFPAFPTYTWEKCFDIKETAEGGGALSADVRSLPVRNFIKKVCAHKDMQTDRMLNNSKSILEKFKKTSIAKKKLIFTTDSGAEPATALDPMTIPLEGVNLPQYTVFDLLGYCMARAVLFDGVEDSGPKPRTAANFYLPLLSLYCRWSQTLTDQTPPSMHSVTWVENSEEVPIKIVLGSTIPSDGNKTKVQEGRLVRIVTASAVKGKALKVTGKDAYPMKPDPKTGKMEKSVKQLFGHCSESNQFIWYPFRLKGTNETIHGLAMEPTRVPKEPYDGKVFKEMLRDPCVNCQRMLRVLLGEQGKKATKTSKKFASGDKALLDDYYEQLGKDSVMAAKQDALDKATSQNVLKFFGIRQLQKDIDAASANPGTPMVRSLAAAPDDNSGAPDDRDEDDDENEADGDEEIVDEEGEASGVEQINDEDTISGDEDEADGDAEVAVDEDIDAEEEGLSGAEEVEDENAVTGEDEVDEEEEEEAVTEEEEEVDDEEVPEEPKLPTRTKAAPKKLRKFEQKSEAD